VIDLHCHVLPAVDDGPATVEEAILLARGAQADGITTIAATPHVDWQHDELDSAQIVASVRMLQRQLDTAGVQIEIVPGAEMSATRALDTSDAELRRLTLGGGPWLLLECPLAATATPGFTTAARSLARRGHRPLLAHPERSPLFLRAPALLDELVADGMLAQVTAASVSGRYGRTVRDLALRLLETGNAHVVASDGHGGHRPAVIAGELSRCGLEPALLEWLAHDMPAALLGGTALPPRPAIAQRRPRRGLRRTVRR
jgi:protein-tyrosine phosphatase